jgi:hypothetical protein
MAQLKSDVSTSGSATATAASSAIEQLIQFYCMAKIKSDFSTCSYRMAQLKSNVSTWSSTTVTAASNAIKLND